LLKIVTLITGKSTNTFAGRRGKNWIECKVIAKKQN
jgi:hypothetical protein